MNDKDKQEIPREYTDFNYPVIKKRFGYILIIACAIIFFICLKSDRILSAYHGNANSVFMISRNLFILVGLVLMFVLGLFFIKDSKRK